MKIKMYGMAPDGEIVRDDAEVFEGSDAQEIVQAMMAATPMANGQTEAVFMGDVLARIGHPGYKLPTEPISACETFLDLLQDRGLAEKIAPPEPLTPLWIKLTGEDGNAFFILGRVRALLRRNGYPQAFIDQFAAEATAGDYNNLLATVARYMTVE